MANFLLFKTQASNVKKPVKNRDFCRLDLSSVGAFEAVLFTQDNSEQATPAMAAPATIET